MTDFIQEHNPFLKLFIKIFKSLFAEQWQDSVKFRRCGKKYIEQNIQRLNLKTPLHTLACTTTTGEVEKCIHEYVSDV